jgi:hypothetical protein
LGFFGFFLITVTWTCNRNTLSISCFVVGSDSLSLSFSAGAFTLGLPPAWVDLSDEIASNVQRARSKMAELAKAHAKALMPSFGDGKEDQHKIEALTHEITDLLKKSEKKLKKLSSGGTSEESNIRKNVQVLYHLKSCHLMA